MSEGNLVMYPSPGYNTQMNPLIDDQEGMRVDNTIRGVSSAACT